MELIAVTALVAATFSLFLSGLILGRMVGGMAARTPQSAPAEEKEDEAVRRARERVQDGVDAIMSYEAPKGFMGDGE